MGRKGKARKGMVSQGKGSEIMERKCMSWNGKSGKCMVMKERKVKEWKGKAWNGNVWHGMKKYGVVSEGKSRQEK